MFTLMQSEAQVAPGGQDKPEEYAKRIQAN
jgi:hypothetical protein